MSEHAPQVVVITGASAGLGRATARAFAREGAKIGLLARGKAGLDGTKRDVEELGGQAIAISVDVADADQVEAAAQQVEDTFGPIDVWVNNAMTSVFSPVKEMQADEYRRVTEVCYLGYVHGTLSALKRMLPRDRGTIIQVGSSLAYRGIPLQSAYCGAKHAIQGFTDSLRTELIHDGSNVHVTEVHMPAMNTPQFGWVKSRLPNKAQPVPPIYQPEVGAEAIVWSAHNKRRELLVGGPSQIVVNGNKIAPALGDWYLAQGGFEDQQRDEPDDPERLHNLWEPVPGDHGAHGDFDAEATSSSPITKASMYRKPIALATAGAASLAGVALFWRKR